MGIVFTTDHISQSLIHHWLCITAHDVLLTKYGKGFKGALFFQTDTSLYVEPLHNTNRVMTHLLHGSYFFLSFSFKKNLAVNNGWITISPSKGKGSVWCARYIIIMIYLTWKIMLFRTLLLRDILRLPFSAMCCWSSNRWLISPMLILNHNFLLLLIFYHMYLKILLNYFSVREEGGSHLSSLVTSSENSVGNMRQKTHEKKRAGKSYKIFGIFRYV